MGWVNGPAGHAGVGFVAVAFAMSTAAADTLNVPSVKYPTIQAAIDAAGADDEVVVAAGTYNEKISFLGKAITVRSADGPEVTTIDGTGLNDSVVKCVSGEGRDTLLSGFTITGGTGEEGFDCTEGGGMLIRHGSPTVVGCRFVRNGVWGPAGGGLGGGMFIESGTPRIEDCLFWDNETDGGTGNGGGIFNFDGSPTVVHCTFRANEGEGISSGGITVASSSFIGHEFGIHAGFGEVRVANCLFLDNTLGAQVANYTAVTVITNSTFTRNSEGLRLVGDSLPVVANCIFWDNAPPGEDPTEVSQISGAVNVTYSLIQGLDTFASGAGNIDGDPLFVDPDGGDFRLRPASPCIDAGSNPAFMKAVGPIGLTTDLDGYVRFVDAPATPDTGVGLGAIIDMGAYEFGSNPGDLDHDGDVDLDDFAVFLDWFTGP